MKVKGLKTTSGRYNISKGQVKEVDKKEAEFLIATGCAKVAEPKARKKVRKQAISGVNDGGNSNSD